MTSGFATALAFVLVALTILVPGIASWSLVDVLLGGGVCGALVELSA